MKHARFVLLIVLAVCLILLVDFSVTLLSCWMTPYAMTGPVSALVCRDGNSMALFAAFAITGVLTLAVAIANIVLCCIDLYRNK